MSRADGSSLPVGSLLQCSWHRATVRARPFPVRPFLGVAPAGLALPARSRAGLGFDERVQALQFTRQGALGESERSLKLCASNESRCPRKPVSALSIRVSKLPERSTTSKCRVAAVFMRWRFWLPMNASTADATTATIGSAAESTPRFLRGRCCQKPCNFSLTR